MERAYLVVNRMHRKRRPWQDLAAAVYHRYRLNRAWQDLAAGSSCHSLLHSAELYSSSCTRSSARLSRSCPAIEPLKRVGSPAEPPAVVPTNQHSGVDAPPREVHLFGSFHRISLCRCPPSASSSLSASFHKGHGHFYCERLGKFQLDTQSQEQQQQEQQQDGDQQGRGGIVLASRGGLKICGSSRADDVSFGPRVRIRTPGHFCWFSSSARSDRPVRSGSRSMGTAGDSLQEDDEDKWGIVFPDPLPPETNQQMLKEQPMTTHPHKLPFSSKESGKMSRKGQPSLTGPSSPSAHTSTSSTRSLTRRILKEQRMSSDLRKPPLGIPENDQITFQGQTLEGDQGMTSSASPPSAGLSSPSFSATQCQQSTSVPLAPPSPAEPSSPGWAASFLSSTSSSPASEEWSSSSVSGAEDGEKRKDEEKGREKNSGLRSNTNVSCEEEDVLHKSVAENHEFSFGNVMLPGLSREDLERLMLESGEQLQLGDQDVPLERQRSLRVGIIGAPNAGKSMLTNCLVGTKISAVSRKTNTTRMEMLGVVSKGDTQLLLYDTPGMAEELTGGSQTLSKESGHLAGIARRVAAQCDVVAVLVDADRQISRPDPRVRNLVARLGKILPLTTKRILCLNKVDAIVDKKDLLELTSDLISLGSEFDRVFMVSARKGSGVEAMKGYFMEQAVLRPWEVEPGRITDRTLKDLALEIVREHIYNRVHKELPYVVEQKHIKWKICRDEALVISQLIIVGTEHQKMIVVGKSGLVIRQIGQGARLELEEFLKRRVHLFLDVIVRPSRGRLPLYPS